MPKHGVSTNTEGNHAQHGGSPGWCKQQRRATHAPALGRKGDAQRKQQIHAQSWGHRDDAQKWEPNCAQTLRQHCDASKTDARPCPNRGVTAPMEAELGPNNAPKEANITMQTQQKPLKDKSKGHGADARKIKPNMGPTPPCKQNESHTMPQQGGHHADANEHERQTVPKYGSQHQHAKQKTTT